MSFNHPVIIFGGGNMGGALARFWNDAQIAGIHVVERDAARRSELGASGIRTYANLSDAPVDKAILVLAIKPQQFSNLEASERAAISQMSLVVSVMAGVKLSTLQEVHKHSARLMPNLPAGVGAGMTVGYAPDLDEPRRRAVQQLFTACGEFFWLNDEAQMHAATAISGSGPAYVFAFLEAFIASASLRGFTPEQARKLATQTLLGAATQAAHSKQDATQLRIAVTSPAGTTEAALKTIGGQFGPILDEATKAAEARSKELA